MLLTKSNNLIKCVRHFNSLNNLYISKLKSIKPNVHVNNLINLNMLHTYKLTPNIKLYSENVLHKNEINQNKSLVIIMAWMMAKGKHLSSYANIYTERDCDVLVVNITPMQLLWPKTGSQLVAKELVNVLNHTEKMPILVHGFSIGAYVFAEALLMLGPNHPVLKRIKGQIWDSAADFSTIAHGLSFATFPNNILARNALKLYILFHTTVFHYFSVVHYSKARNNFFSGVLSAPTLIFCSENDLIGTASANLELKTTFESKNIDVTFKCWNKSKHVKHYNEHKEEYLDVLYSFLNKIGFPTNLKAKL